MNNVVISFDHSFVPADQLSKKRALLEPLIQKASSYDIATVLNDTQGIQAIGSLIEHKKKHNPAMMIVVGIGGSNLGAQAVYEALYGKEGNPHFPLYFADTVDSDRMHALLQRAEHALKTKRTILITVISKSGTTAETIVNFECFLALLKKYEPNKYHEYIIAITDEGSALWKLAEQQRFDRLVIPKNCGGRYSVFTAAGLAPLFFAQVDVDALIKGAQAANIQAAATSASVVAYQYEQGKRIHDVFVFDAALEGIGKWYRQLMGESIGKDGKGITPTVSIGSIDLHSVGQLYLGGPRNTLTTFVTVVHPNHEVYVPDLKEYDALVSHVQGKPLASIMKAISDGTKNAYAENKIPFISIEFPKKGAFYVGQVMQTRMFQIIMLGHLLEVNPFDQPQVELYKTQTRKILAHE